ncbi:MAG: transcriptional regulator [Saccharospirillum sp.]|nr:transcriptional regulator [Saccharospirillum sp.]
MFNWLKNAFTGSAQPKKEDFKGEAVEYNGYQITPTPIAEGGQYRVSGLIEKGEQQHHFIRSDLVAGQEEACSFSVVKAKLIIDQLGDRIFEQN